MVITPDRPPAAGRPASSSAVPTSRGRRPSRSRGSSPRAARPTQNPLVDTLITRRWIYDEVLHAWVYPASLVEPDQITEGTSDITALRLEREDAVVALAGSDMANTTPEAVHDPRYPLMFTRRLGRGADHPDSLLADLDRIERWRAGEHVLDRTHDALHELLTTRGWTLQPEDQQEPEVTDETDDDVLPSDTWVFPDSLHGDTEQAAEHGLLPACVILDSQSISVLPAGPIRGCDTHRDPIGRLDFPPGPDTVPTLADTLDLVERHQLPVHDLIVCAATGPCATTASDYFVPA